MEISFSNRSISKVYLDENNYMKTFFDSYEDSITNGLKHIFNINSVSDGKTFSIHFREHRFEKPKITPIEARRNHDNYAAKLNVDIEIYKMKKNKITREYEDEEEPIKIVKNWNICLFPVMLGSSICILHDLKPYERIQYEECDDDPLGYFIMKGTEKCLVSQEKLATNQYFTLIKKGDTISECRSVRKADGLSMIKLGIKDNIINIFFTKKMPIHLRDFLEFICEHYEIDFNEIKLRYMSEMKDARMSEVMITTLSGKTKKKKKEDEEEETDLSFFENKNIDVLFLPHIEKPLYKFEYLLLMIKNLLKVEFGLKKPSNRDSYANKRIEPVGTLISQLFSKLFSNMTTLTNKMLRGEEPYTRKGGKRTKTIGFDPERSNINSILDTNHLQYELSQAFITSKWTASGLKAKTGVVILLEAVNRIRQISNLRKISISGARAFTKIDKPRRVDPSSYGEVCVASMTEGQLAGLVKELALSAYITFDVSGEDVINYIENFKPQYQGNDFIFVNGKMYGKCDGKIMRELLINLRREGKIHPHTSISFVPEKDRVETTNFLKINSSVGRIVRPLIILGDNNIPNYQIRGYNSDSLRKLTVSDMLEQHIIEYVDAIESEFLYIAMTSEDLDKNRKFTHMEIDPSFMFGVIANLQQFPQHMPAPRISLTTGKIVQQIGIPFLNYQKRDDTSSKILWYPQNTLLQTDMMKRLIKLNKEHQPEEGSLIPSVQNVVIAIMPFLGYNVDDAIIVNRKFLDLGGFRSTSYEIHEIPDVEISETTEIIKKFNRIEYIPLKQDVEQHTEQILYKSTTGFTTTHIYSKRNVDELLKSKIRGYGIDDIDELGEKVREFTIGDELYYEFERKHKTKTRVKPGDILVKYEKKEKVSKKGKESVRKIQHQYKDAPGIIESVDKLGEGYKKMIRIRIKTDNIPEVGDKIFAPYSQKSVIGFIVDPEDLPFDPVTGIIPDVIMSPSAFPSRMTIGMLLDIIAGRAISMGKTGTIRGDEILIPIFDEIPNSIVPISSYSKKLRDIISLEFQSNLQKYKDTDKLSYDDIELILQKYKRITVEEQKYDDLSQWQKDLYDKLFRTPTKEDIIGIKELSLDQHSKWRKQILEELEIEFPLEEDLTYSMLTKKQKKKIDKYYEQKDKSLPITNDNIINMKYQLYNMFKNENIEELKKIRISTDGEGKYKLQGNDLTIYWIKTIHLKLPDVSASAFAKPKYDEIVNYMKQFGQTEKVEMINGITGEQMSASITMGIVGYYVLKHMAKNKMRVRDTGRRSLANRQPIKGKAEGGGIRIGEMERTVIESHGDAFFLQQVMKDTSDLTTIFVCENCKEMCYKDVHNITHCERCQSLDLEHKISRVNAPYSLCMLYQLNTALGITLKMDLDKTRNIYASFKQS